MLRSLMWGVILAVVIWHTVRPPTPRYTVFVFLRTPDGMDGIKGATVTIDGRKVITGTDGKATFPGMTAGTWLMAVDSPAPYKAFTWLVKVPPEGPLMFKMDRVEKAPSASPVTSLEPTGSHE